MGLRRRSAQQQAMRMRREYGQYCPVALAAESLAERWTLLVVRELLLGARRFNDIRRGVPRMSATLLKQRLQTLERAEIVERCKSESSHGTEYRMTAAGLELRPIVFSIGEWGQRWARDMKPIDLDPSPLVWAMHRRLNTPAMPSGTTVIALEFMDTRLRQRHFWLVHRDGNVDVCLKDPGYEVTIRIVTRIRTMVEVWRGISLAEGRGARGNHPASRNAGQLPRVSAMVAAERFRAHQAEEKLRGLFTDGAEVPD